MQNRGSVAETPPIQGYAFMTTVYINTQVEPREFGATNVDGSDLYPGQNAKPESRTARIELTGSN